MIITIDTKELLPTLFAILIFPFIIGGLIIFYICIGVVWLVMEVKDLLFRGHLSKEI